MTRRRTRARRPDVVASPARHQRPVWPDAVLGTLALGAAASLMSIFLTHASALWRDEVSSVNTQLIPTLSGMWDTAQFESFPAFWMVLLRGWIRVAGSSDAALRLFGLIGPAVLLAGVWIAAWRLGRIVPVLALTILATNPEVMRWSGTLRPWGLGAGFALVAVAVLSTTPNDRRRSSLILAAVIVIVAVQTVFQNLIILAVTAGVLLFTFQAFGRRLIPVGIIACAALTLVPYAGVLQRRAEWNDLGASHVLYEDLWNGFWRLASSGGTLATGCVLALLAAAIAILAHTAWRSVLRSAATSAAADAPAEIAPVLAGMAVASAAALGGFYWTLGYPTQAWYYIGLLAIVVTLGEAAVRAAVPSATPVVRSAALVILASGVVTARQPMREPLTNVDVIGSRLGIEARRGDLIVAHPWFLGVTLSRYYHGPAHVITIPPMTDRTVSRYDLLKERMTDPHAVQPVIAAVDRTLSSGHRVWLVGNYDVPPDGTPDTALRLPTPPLPESGWNSAPYELLWGFQVGQHLRTHAIYDVVVKVGRRGGRLEDVALRRFSGRRE